MVAAAFGRRASGLRLERMKASPRWSEGTFRNTHAIEIGLERGTAAPTIAELMCGGQRRAPPGPLATIDPRE